MGQWRTHHVNSRSRQEDQLPGGTNIVEQARLFAPDASNGHEATTPPDDPSVPIEKVPFRFIDLFAGIGGMRLGFEAAGGRCVYTVENDRWACQTYSANFGPTEPIDINALEPAKVAAYDVLAAGFPCQPFSIAGVTKKTALGRKHGFDDPTSGNLFLKTLRLIGSRRHDPPPVVVFENVKNLLSHDKRRTYSIIKGVLDGIGYEVTERVIDARPWVPQHRERIFIVGFHRDDFGGRAFDFDGVRVPPEDQWPHFGDIEAPVVEPRYVLSPHLWQYLQDYATRHKSEGHGFGFGLVARDGHTRTLSARYHKDGSEILVPMESGPPRRLTPGECAALMGFPAHFKSPVSDTQAYRQFGNAVVVPVVAALAQALVEQVDFAGVRAARR
jgi:DNA (cytosine-5)-methyltransferase 1